MDTIRELTYLRDLTKKYGAHYLSKYFGFSLKEIADRMGIAKNTFTLILQGKRSLVEARKEAFLKAFNELKIEEKTKDFKISASQTSIKELYQRIKFLTKCLPFAILLSMGANFLEYILAVVGKSRLLLIFFKRAFEFYSNAFCFLAKENNNIFCRKLNYYSWAFLF